MARLRSGYDSHAGASLRHAAPNTTSRGTKRSPPDGSEDTNDFAKTGDATATFGQGRYPGRTRESPEWLGQSVEAPKPSLPAQPSPKPKRKRRRLNTRQRKRNQPKHKKAMVSEKPAVVECTACFSTTPHTKAFTCSCSHSYCSECLENLFNAAMGDETLFPPRCFRCAETLETAAHRLLPEQALQLLRQRTVEHNTPASQRVYCHKPQCSAFIPTEGTDKNAVQCSKCRAWTCKTCKGASHQAGDCPEDEGLKEVLELSVKQKWQRCRNCKTMIELNQGCKHISRFRGIPSLSSHSLLTHAHRLTSS